MRQRLFLLGAVLAALAITTNTCRAAEVANSSGNSPRSITEQTQVISAELLALWTEPAGKLMLAGGKDGTLLRSGDGGQHWQQVAINGAPEINSFAANPQGTLLAGTSGGLLRSVDEGLTWGEVPLPAGNPVTKAIFRASNNSWVASSGSGAILVSRDDGLTWRVINTANTIPLLTIGETATGVLLTGGGRGTLLRSGDGGEHWSAVRTDSPSSLARFLQLPGKTGILTLWADGSVIGLDQNAQRIWHTTSGTSDFISAVTYDTHGKQALLATARGKVLRSRDGGHTWKSAMVVDNTYLSGIYADPQSGAITTVGSRATVARSRDGGTNWELLHGNAWTSRLAALSVDANGDNLLAAGSGGLMLRSTDRGLTWTETHADLGRYVGEVLAVPGSKALVAVGNDGLLLRSTDTGRNWSVIAMSTSKPLPAPVSLQSLIYEPHSAALIAAGPVGTILRSQDTGLTWQAIQPIPDAGEGFLRQVVADPDTGVLVAVGDIGGVMRSIDSGRTWIKSEAPAGKTVDQVVALGQGVFVAIATNTPNAVMLRSTDGGSHWQSVDAALKGSLTGLYAEPQNKVVWVMGQGIQMGSHDAGASWTQTQVPAEVNMSFMLRTATKTLLAFGKGGVILRSTNDGSTWQVIPGPNTSSLRKPLIDAKTQAIYVPGRDGTLLRSKDDGKSWEILPLHTNAHVNRLVLDDTTRTLILTGERIIRVVLPD